MTHTTKHNARIVPVAASNVQGYRWRWRSTDGEHRSASEFELFHDCLEDARRNGYEVDLEAAAPRSDQSRLA